jgi:hypothetical protein
MKKTFYLFSLLFLLNGCIESVAFLGSSVGGASSGKIIQSTMQSTISYGVKKRTGKTPLGHALAYAEKNNPEGKKENCISFIEKTKSEFCTIAKNKISLTNKAVKEKITSAIINNLKTTKQVTSETVIKTNNINVSNQSNNFKNFSQSNKSPKELAIFFQAELKKLKDKYNYLARR